MILPFVCDGTVPIALGILVWAKNSSKPFCAARCLMSVKFISPWPLLFPGSATLRRYYRRPEQKLADHAEDTGRHHHHPPARSQPKPRDLLDSLDSREQVIGEKEKTKQSCRLVGKGTIA